MDWNKKRKKATPVWRPVSTQSTSIEECVEGNITADPENVTSIEHGENEGQIVSIVRAIADSTISSSSLQAENKVGQADERVAGPTSSCQSGTLKDAKIVSSVSKEKHAISVEAVKSPSLDYSHFISLPLAVYPELVEKLVKFQSFILGDSSQEDEGIVKPGKALDVAEQLKVEDDADSVKVALDVPLVSYAAKASNSRTSSELGIDKTIFIKPKTFHLTILMLKLWNKERVQAATEVLQSVSSKVIEALDNRPLCLRIKGLDLMRGSKSKAHILYAPIEEIGNEGRLSRACQIIIDAYVEAGLVLEKDIGQKLKLHATLMNSSHRKLRDRKGKRSSQPFDATTIFEKFESEHWGDYHIREAHLSQRFLYDQNGYYHCCASLPLPEIPSTSS